ncbi:MAG: four helix bundle protein [Candidatus Marinimicrobia bacterium]|nr:four helix bundle protein [Candidatus Neomarinimicrobiota bacterium]
MQKHDLEDRLVDFAVLIIELSNQLPNNEAGKHLKGQIIRSATSAALNYGEAQSGESRKDLIHKIKIVLKELRETFVGLKIIQRAALIKTDEKLTSALSENDQLISIFVKSVETAQKNLCKN